jgi:hypothetical protein
MLDNPEKTSKEIEKSLVVIYSKYGCHMLPQLSISCHIIMQGKKI